MKRECGPSGQAGREASVVGKANGNCFARALTEAVVFDDSIGLVVGR